MPALNHDGLLTLARKVYATASDADAARLRDDLGAFVHALSAHLEHEIPMLSCLPPAEARLLRRGQARVSAAARTLLSEAADSCVDRRSRCTAHTEELLALLTLQTRDERLALHRKGTSRR